MKSAGTFLRLFAFLSLIASIGVVYQNCGKITSISDPLRPTGVDGDTSLSITVKLNGEANSSPGPLMDAGESFQWSFEVKNTGSEPVDQLTLSDNVPGLILCPVSVIGVGETVTCTQPTRALMETYSGEIAAAAKTASGKVVGGTTQGYYRMESFVQFETVTVDGADATTEPGPSLSSGADIQYSFFVKNISRVQITQLEIWMDEYRFCTFSHMNPGITESCVMNWSGREDGPHAEIYSARVIYDRILLDIVSDTLYYVME